MKVVLIIAFLLTSVLSGYAKKFIIDGKSIADVVANAKTGDTILIKSGYYRTENIVINKSLTIIGEGLPTLDASEKAEIFIVKAKNVTIQGIRFLNTSASSTNDDAAIKAETADGLKVINCVLINSFFGIHISNTDKPQIIGNQISRAKKGTEISAGNAIHLWKCHDALISDNHVSNHRDGIYLEFTTQSIIKRNHSEKNVRYGLHFMFSNENQYIENEFVNNGAGVAVMYTYGIKMVNNLFANNWGPAAYGLLLKDIRDSEVKNNRFLNNTMGIYMEGSSRIKFSSNEFSGNGYAIRVQASCDGNEFIKNNFEANTFDIATNGTMVLNKMERNYWDKYEGYDLNKDGLGDTSYHPVNLYSMIVERVPVSMLLWRSFMVFLLDRAEKNLPAITPENLIDSKPSMKPYDLIAKSN